MVCTIIAGDCGCVHALDVYIQFPNGLKRPDISIFCREPGEAEQDSFLTMVPEAVVEVVSQGYEAKDLEIGPPFYLSQGVKDVIVFDPRTLFVGSASKPGEGAAADFAGEYRFSVRVWREGLALRQRGEPGGSHAV